MRKSKLIQFTDINGCIHVVNERRIFSIYQQYAEARSVIVELRDGGSGRNVEVAIHDGIVRSAFRYVEL